MQVQTEGDAFLVAFHAAEDAVAWCCATQQALLAANWPRRLERHHRSCVRQNEELVALNKAGVGRGQPSRRTALRPRVQVLGFGGRGSC